MVSFFEAFSALNLRAERSCLLALTYCKGDAKVEMDRRLSCIYIKIKYLIC